MKEKIIKCTLGLLVLGYAVACVYTSKMEADECYSVVVECSQMFSTIEDDMGIYEWRGQLYMGEALKNELASEIWLAKFCAGINYDIWY